VAKDADIERQGLLNAERKDGLPNEEFGIRPPAHRGRRLRLGGNSKLELRDEVKKSWDPDKLKAQSDSTMVV